MEPRDRGEAQEGLVDERVAQEVGLVSEHHRHPGAHHPCEQEHGEQQRGARRPLVRRRQRAPSSDPAEQRQREADGALGERRSRHRDSRSGHEPRCPAVDARADQTPQRQGDEGRERHVEDGQPREDQDERRGRDHRRREEGPRPVGEPARDAVGEGDRRDGAGGGGQPGSELVDAQHREAAAREPEQHRRLVEIGKVVEMRHGPAAELQHLARHLGVAALVGLEQRPATEPVEVRQRREREERHTETGAQAPRASQHQPEHGGALARDRQQAAARRVLRLAGAARPVLDRHLRDPQAGEREQRRQPAMRVVEQRRLGREPCERVGAEHPRRAGEILEPGRQQQPAEAVGDERRHPPRGRIAPPDADAAGEVGVAQRLDQARQVFRAALQVGVEGRDQLAPRDAEAREQRRGLAGSPVVSEVAQPGLRGGQRGQHLLGLIAAAVVDDDQLPGDGGGVERLAYLGHQGAQVRGLVVGRDHDAQPRRGRMAVAGRRVPHRVTSASWSGLAGAARNEKGKYLRAHEGGMKCSQVHAITLTNRVMVPSYRPPNGTPRPACRPYDRRAPPAGEKATRYPASGR